MFTSTGCGCVGTAETSTWRLVCRPHTWTSPQWVSPLYSDVRQTSFRTWFSHSMRQKQTLTLNTIPEAKACASCCSRHCRVKDWYSALWRWGSGSLRCPWAVWCLSKLHKENIFPSWSNTAKAAFAPRSNMGIGISKNTAVVSLPLTSRQRILPIWI